MLKSTPNTQELRSFINISGLKHFWTGLEMSSKEHERDKVSKAFAQPIPFAALSGFPSQYTEGRRC